MGKPDGREPRSMLPFGVRPTRVEDIEREQIEAYRAQGGATRIIEHSAHNVDDTTGRDGRPDMPECLQRIVRRKDLEETSA